jgi:glycosyltransferase involved in cell wall biosynthesis
LREAIGVNSKKPHMRVSIVTISFNQAEFLERAIRSVVEQDYPNIEYIVVDPGSTDGSRDIIERYRARIAKVIYEPDRGPADGLNKGFACATGEIFGYINADDAYLPGAVSEGVAALKESKADVVYGDGYIVDEHDRCIRRYVSSPFNFRRFVLGAVGVLQQSTFFFASAYRDIGGFNIENRTCWDGELLYDLAARGKTFHHVPRYWSVFRLYPTSISGSGRWLQQYYRDQERIVKAAIARYRWILPIAKVAARVEKHLVSPTAALLRVRDRLWGTPEIKL